jgi:hypothetical protein
MDEDPSDREEKDLEATVEGDACNGVTREMAWRARHEEEDSLDADPDELIDLREPGRGLVIGANSELETNATIEPFVQAESGITPVHC